MMSIGLHCRLVGQPGRFMGLKRFIDYIQSKDKVWIARRIDIARHWAQHHPYVAPDLVPSEMDRTEFVGHFGSIFEHSPWIAERAFDGELGPANDTATGLHFALRNQFRMATDEERLGVLTRPPRSRRQARRRPAPDRSLDRRTGLGRPRRADRRTSAASSPSSTPPTSTNSASPSSSPSATTPRQMILDTMRVRLGNTRDTEFAHRLRPGRTHRPAPPARDPA